jgi:hypothetical protein
MLSPLLPLAPAACALHLPADSLLPALTRSLEAMKQPAARVSVMEFAVLFLGDGKVAGAPSAPGAIRCVALLYVEFVGSCCLHFRV